MLPAKWLISEQQRFVIWGMQSVDYRQGRERKRGILCYRGEGEFRQAVINKSPVEGGTRAMYYISLAKL